VARWKRKTEQTERECASLKESVHRLASKANDLEEDRIRLEHTLELKDSLTSALMAKSIEGMPIIPAETLSSTSIPLLTSSSTKFEILHSRASKEMKEKDVQTDQVDQERNTNDYQNILEDKAKLEELVGKLKICIVEMESNLKGKDELISELKTVRAQQDRESQRSPVEKDLKDALMVLNHI
jgi:predicted  nucleic acid-binding Zn-ribbon protein